MLIQAFGRMKEEHQKVVIPDTTVLIKSNLPAKDKALADQEEKHAFTCWIRGSQLARVSFLVQSGTPRYFIDRVPHFIPVET